MADEAFDAILLFMETMGTKVVVRGRGWFGSALVLANAALGCSSGGGTTPGDTSNEVGPICAACTDGGQTSDFGSTDACSEGAGDPIELAAAQALGFTDLAALERDFDLPLSWIPQATSLGGPATGYDPSSVIHGRTTLAALEHVQPTTSGCEDFVRVTLNLELETEDQAIRVGGQVVSPARRRAASSSASGRLDLNDASGTLRLFPDDWGWVVYGNLNVVLHFRPDRVRGWLSVTLTEHRLEGDTGSPGNVYYPLQARFPLDACELHALPFEANQPGATPAGLSALELRSELQALLGSEPIPGGWGDGTVVSVETTLGQPRNTCAEESALSYELPLTITSRDGRIEVSKLARASTRWNADGNVETASVEYVEQEPLTSAAFPQGTGITGVDLGDVPAARWFTELHLVAPDGGAPHGRIVIEGVDIGGEQTGIEGAVLGPVATFTWVK